MLSSAHVCVPRATQATKGVLDTVVGYCGGTTSSPTYERIGDHTEALRVTFDQRELPLESVLRLFWQGHSPMPLSFTGTQYRSAVFCHSPTQRRVAEHVRSSLSGDSPFSNPCELTAIEGAGSFYRAEEYHQRFLAKQRSGAFPWAATI